MVETPDVQVKVAKSSPHPHPTPVPKASARIFFSLYTLKNLKEEYSDK